MSMFGAVQDSKDRVAPYPEFPEFFEVENAEDYAAAAAFLAEVKAQIKMLEADKQVILKPYNQVVKDVRTVFAPKETHYANVERTLKTAIKGYTDKLEAKRRAEEARLREEQRLERKRLEDELALARQDGHVDIEMEIEDEIDSLFTPTLARAPLPKSGVTTREAWKGEVTDLMELVKAVATNQAPLALLQINQTALTQLARLHKDTQTVPGVRIYRDDVVVARS